MGARLGNLVELTFRSTHELTEKLFELTATRELRSKRFFVDQLEDAAVSALAELATARMEIHGDYFAKREVLAAVRRARGQLTECDRLLRFFAATQARPQDRIVDLLDATKECSALLMATTVAVRGYTNARIP